MSEKIGWCSRIKYFRAGGKIMFDSTNIDKIVPTLRRYSPSLDRMKKNHMEKLH